MTHAENEPYCDPAWRTRMKRACDALNAVLKEAKEHHPHAQLYMEAEGHLNLMWGAPHGDVDGSGPSVDQHQERVLCNAKLRTGCGAW